MTTLRFAATCALLHNLGEGASGWYRYPFLKGGQKKVTDIRLAYNPGPCVQYPGIRKEDMKLRLAWSRAFGPKNLTKEKLAPSVRLAHIDGAQGDNTLKGQRGVKQLPATSAPALLVSFYYRKSFLKHQDKFLYRDWVMDSGAYSAHNSGVTIDLLEYIETCQRLLKEDKTLTEVFALDVIGDDRASLQNCELMWEAGVPAIPCFHANEPWDALLHMAKTYPKIALGGVALAKTGKKLEWAKQCFARVWPKKIHGFAFCSEEAIMTLPFHSVDSTSWEIGACGFGNWKAFGKMSVRGSQQNLRAEVEYYLAIERRAQSRWKKEMERLEQTCGPTVRLASQGMNNSRGNNLCRRSNG